MSKLTTEWITAVAKEACNSFPFALLCKVLDLLLIPFT